MVANAELASLNSSVRGAHRAYSYAWFVFTYVSPASLVGREVQA